MISNYDVAYFDTTYIHIWGCQLFDAERVGGLTTTCEGFTFLSSDLQ